MTIKTDDLDPVQGADDVRPDAAEQAPGTTPDTPSQAPASTDPDALELAAARAEVEAEAKAAEAPQQQSEAPPVEQPPAQQQAAAPEKKAPPPPVPYERFSEAVRKLRAAEEKAAYLEGALHATRGSNPPTAPASAGTEATAPQAAPAAADPLASEIAASRASLREQAKRFDRGEITLDEYEGVRADVEDKILALQTRRIQAQIAASTAPEPGIADQAIEETHLGRLYDTHAYAANLSTEQAQALADMARTNLTMAGRPIGTGRKETLRLREEVARLSDVFGPQWGVTPRQQSAPNRPQQQPAQPKPPVLSSTAQARQAKMGMAAGLPPDPAGMGMAATSELTEAQILRMTDEQIMALPAQARMRILNSA